MMPEEWPIAVPGTERNAPARAAGGRRLSTVRTDFFLDPAERLTEQERALMTAMLHCLITELASEIAAALPPGWVGANDDEASLIAALARAELLDEPELIALLLRRADEERIGSAARARNGRRDARLLQGLVSHEDGAVSAAAMALILGLGRRRDRFGQCLIAFDDLSPQLAEILANNVAAALRRQVAGGRDPAAADAELSEAGRRLVARHDPTRSVEALTRTLVAVLSDAGGLTDDLLLGAAQEGEMAFLAEAIAHRVAISGDVAVAELLSGQGDQIMRLLRAAGVSRELGAGILASIGDLLGIDDPGAAIAMFDGMSAEDAKAAASWLGAAPAYRTALQALGQANG